MRLVPHLPLRSAPPPGPGRHLFGQAEAEELRAFLRQVVQCGWDAHVLPVRTGRSHRRLWCSHDGWIALAADEAADLTSSLRAT